MVFPSLPLYHLDPTPNWPQQQPNQQHPLVIPTQNPQPPPPPMAAGGGGGGSTRAGSMADRARLAKISQPETALKCPRCESTNTKFCYYNNYSLSQPRHFCKACRRYWTRGGALRNVPVGGGCRRKNRRSNKAKSSKSPMITPTTKEAAALLASASASASASANNDSSSSFCPSRRRHHHHHHHLPSHQYSNDVVSGGISGLQFGGLTYNIGNGAAGSNISMLSNNNAFVPSLPHDHHQQFPTLFTNLELEAPSMELLHDDQFQPSRSSSTSTLLYSALTHDHHHHHHLTTTIKMEPNILPHSANHAPDHFLVANSDINAWTIPTNFIASSSTTHLL